MSHDGAGFYPCAEIKGLLWEIEVVWGDKIDHGNLFRWDNVRLNIPGDLYYSPTIY